MFFIGPVLALRAGHPCFFSVLNPGWAGGGIGFESKYGILSDVPEAIRPKGIRTIPRTELSGQVAIMNQRYPVAHQGKPILDDLSQVPADDFTAVLNALQRANITFPLIAKPDVGFRGLIVEKIQNKEQLANYLAAYPIPLILQELIVYPDEVGVLYYRAPGIAQGQITSITTKEFLTVTGDGKSNLRQLIQAYDRARRQLNRLENEFGAQLDRRIPAKGEVCSLGKIGNHSKGTAFLDGTPLISPALEAYFDRIADQMPNFVYGRFDLRCSNFIEAANKLCAQAELVADEVIGPIKVLEINGALAEPTHIYDPNTMHYFSALKAIIKHWMIIGQLSIMQIRGGVKPLGFRDMIARLLAMRKYVKAIKTFDAERNR